MKLSVIIPCYNAAATLGVQLDALTTQQWSQPWEIVLADNRSTDNSRQIAESYRERLPNLRIVDASDQQGQPFALNTAIQAALGESVAICDADDEVNSSWVSAMGDALSCHDFVACRLDTIKLNPKWLQGHEQESGLQTIWYPPWLPHAGGGTLGFKKSLFDKIGEFSDALPYLHDTDYCFRAQMRGYTLHFVSDAVLHVRGRDCLWGHFRQSRNFAEYNVILAKLYWPEGACSGRFYRIFLVEWIKLFAVLPRLSTRRGRYSWMWKCGRQVGRLKGMIRHRGVPV